MRDQFDAEPRGSLDVVELREVEEAISDDLNTRARAGAARKSGGGKGHAGDRFTAVRKIDRALRPPPRHPHRDELRVQPKDATIDEATIEARLTERKEARAAKDFARSDAIRDELAAAGVEVMDGDPLGWDWKLSF